MAKEASATMTLETVRDSLSAQEDTIIYSLIDRVNYPLNSKTYDQSASLIPGFAGSLVEYVVKETEAVHAKILHPVASSININKRIWDIYFNKLLPLIAAPGDDGNYASTAASDLKCLQALSRRIHYGKFVAEIKFTDSPQDYEPLVRVQDSDALMNLLTFKKVEEMVKRRVEKKAAVFGQRVGLDDSKPDQKPKIDPAIVSRLYDEWVMPLTKLVEVEYLLRRLD
ncbi:hypothetical protein CDL15_Pgr022498 [Punica granatum]|uniref:chorismate mutase n=1 Tax=Punica granatum TaxID=22663 RepID=A0A218XQY1_PUNGR|nr:hypothetical protein CDL15_Pgr022498 [Punica granatum]